MLYDNSFRFKRFLYIEVLKLSVFIGNALLCTMGFRDIQGGPLISARKSNISLILRNMKKCFREKFLGLLF